MSRPKKNTEQTVMEHRQATRLDKIEKRQQDFKKGMDQIMEMMMGWTKEKWIYEDPNSQKVHMYEKNDNCERGIYQIWTTS